MMYTVMKAGCSDLLSSEKKEAISWIKSFYQIGSKNALRARDHNADGVLNVIMSAGTQELTHDEHGVFALNRMTLNTLWTQSNEAQMVGPAVFIAFDLYEIPDVLIDGRAGTLTTISDKDGRLYFSIIEDLKSADLSGVRTLLSGAGHGIFVPPSLVELNADENLDVTAINHAETACALDGNAWQTLRSHKFSGVESSTLLAVGYFNCYETTENYWILNPGTWPACVKSVQVPLDGLHGASLSMDAMGYFFISCAVTVDLTRDGLDESFLSVSEDDCDTYFKEVFSGAFSRDKDRLTPLQMAR